MQREDVLGEALKLLEVQGIANTTLEMVAERIDYPLMNYNAFGPTKRPFCTMRYVTSASGWISGGVSFCWMTR